MILGCRSHQHSKDFKVLLRVLGSSFDRFPVDHHLMQFLHLYRVWILIGLADHAFFESSINVLLQVHGDGQSFDIGRVVLDANGLGSAVYFDVSIKAWHRVQPRLIGY